MKRQAAAVISPGYFSFRCRQRGCRQLAPAPPLLVFSPASRADAAFRPRVISMLPAFLDFFHQLAAAAFRHTPFFFSPDSCLFSFHLARQLFTIFSPIDYFDYTYCCFH